MRYFVFAFYTGMLSFIMCPKNVLAQNNTDSIYRNNIRTVRFYVSGNQLSLPVYKLNSNKTLELDFDDLDADVKNYYYTYQLCDYDWQPVDISPFEYLNGFSQGQITNYTYSSIAYTNYTHYQVVLPESNSVPNRTGNYLLKVYLDGDTSQLVFTRRLLVTDHKVSVVARVVPPFGPSAATHQRIQFIVNAGNLNSFSAGQQLKVVVLQNFRWDNAQWNVDPTFVRGNSVEYNSENNFVFHGGKEWRWLDIRNFRLQTEHIAKIETKKRTTDIYLRTDVDRSDQKYFYYADMNGMYSTDTYDNNNPASQSDYATVHFSFLPPNHQPYNDKELYIIGQLTDYNYGDVSKLVFNPATGLYEINLFLKQGYYDYGFSLVDTKGPSQSKDLEGDAYETENNYTILVYYKSFTDQADQLVGVTTINSRASAKVNINF